MHDKWGTETGFVEQYIRGLIGSTHFTLDRNLGADNRVDRVHPVFLYFAWQSVADFSGIEF